MNVLLVYHKKKIKKRSKFDTFVFYPAPPPEFEIVP